MPPPIPSHHRARSKCTARHSRHPGWRLDHLQDSIRCAMHAPLRAVRRHWSVPLSHTCKRVCGCCVTLDKLYLPLRPGSACYNFGLDRQTVKRLPSMRVIPGMYGVGLASPEFSTDCTVAQPVVLVDYQSAHDAALAKHGSLSVLRADMSRAASRTLESGLARYLASQPSASIAPPGFAPAMVRENRFRFVAIVQIPWLKRAVQQAG